MGQHSAVLFQGYTRLLFATSLGFVTALVSATLCTSDATSLAFDTSLVFVTLIVVVISQLFVGSSPA